MQAALIEIHSEVHSVCGLVGHLLCSIQWHINDSTHNHNILFIQQIILIVFLISWTFYPVQVAKSIFVPVCYPHATMRGRHMSE